MENLGDMPIGKKVRLDIAMKNEENISSSSSSSSTLLIIKLDKNVRLSNILYPNEPEYLTVLILSFNNEQERIYKTFAKGKYHTHKKQEHK